MRAPLSGHSFAAAVVLALCGWPGVLPAQHQEEPEGRFVPPTAGTWETVRSLGQPRRWKTSVVLGFREWIVTADVIRALAGAPPMPPLVERALVRVAEGVVQRPERGPIPEQERAANDPRNPAPV